MYTYRDGLYDVLRYIQLRVAEAVWPYDPGKITIELGED